MIVNLGLGDPKLFQGPGVTVFWNEKVLVQPLVGQRRSKGQGRAKKMEKIRPSTTKGQP